MPTDMFRDLISCKVHQVATLELLQSLESTNSTVSLIQLLLPIIDIDILLEKADKPDFIKSVDRFVHDTPFIPFFRPQVDADFMPHEVYIRRQHIWHSVFWLYSQRHANHTCSKCLEQPNNILLHWLFDGDKQSDYRLFILTALDKLKQSDPSLATHPLFQLIHDWYDAQNCQDHDTDILDTIFRLFVAPLATPQKTTMSVHQSTIIRSLFINMCAMAIPNLRALLQPLHWYNVQPSLLVDLEDSRKAKNISLRKYTSSNVKLCDLSFFRQHLSQTDFPIFGSAKTRRQDHILQASATSFIKNIQDQHPGEYFLWSDGAYIRSKPYAAVATLVTLNDQVWHSSSDTINTSNIATAEICGIILNLIWLLQCSNPPPSVHIMCDNQYAIKGCLRHCKIHPLHLTLFHSIYQSVKHLLHRTQIHFHWIPGHTNNKFHSQVDRLASQCLRNNTTFTLTLHELLNNHTDAMASGGVHHP